MSAAHEPAVGVVIPVYNGARYLAEAIESALAQIGCRLHVTVVDDGSDDGSLDVARAFSSVRCLSQERKGAAAARNLGAAASDCEFVAFLDADDVWTEGALAHCLEFFAGDNSLEAVFGHVEQFRSPDLAPEAAARLACPELPMVGYQPGSMLARRRAFERVGPFASDWRVGEFLDWYARAVDAKLRSLVTERVVLRRRLHETNSGVVRRDASGDYARVIKAALDRRRASRARGTGEG